jgi:hypothetical protein
MGALLVDEPPHEAQILGGTRVSGVQSQGALQQVVGPPQLTVTADEEGLV